jgi:hypothetical protein
MRSAVYHPWRDASSLIATAAYTRGLWSVLFLWRAVMPRAFKGRPTEWGVDEAFIQTELKRALMLFIPLTALQGVLFFVYIRWSSVAAAFLFVLSLLLQWAVIPWLAARRVMGEQRSTLIPAATCTVVAPSADSPISDLGFLLREASFAVDTSTAQSESEQPETPQQIANALLDRLESRFGAAWDQGVTAQRVRVIPADVAQPARWSFAKSGSHLDVSANDGTERLVIFGQRPGEDGLAAVEFSAGAIKGHLSITLRARWLPPLRRRFSRLACLPLQKTWWRAVAVPVGLTIGLLLVFALFVIPQWLASGTLARAGGAFVQGMVRPAMMTQAPPATESTPDTTAPVETNTSAVDTAFDTAWITVPTETVITEIPATATDDPYATLTPVDSSTAEAEAPLGVQAEEIMPQPDAAPAIGPQPGWLDLLFSGLSFLPQFFSLTLIVMLAALVAFLPVAGFAVLLLTRLLRYTRGFLYAITGTVMNVATPRCYRFRASQLSLGEDGAVRSGLQYLQIIEESVLDTLIAALQERNIDTKSIRAEAQVLINEGIYMTGGSLAASNVVVGAFAKIAARGRRKLAHAGKVSYGAMQQKQRRAG